MNIETFNPHLLECKYQDYNEHVGSLKYEPFPPRTTRFHEIDIITYGKGIDVVQGREYHVETGDVFYRTDGLHNIHYRPYYCYFLVFDPVYDPAKEDQYSFDILGDLRRNVPPDKPWDPIPPFNFSSGPRLGKLTKPERVIRIAGKLLAAWNNTSRDGLQVKMLFLTLLYELRSQLNAYQEASFYDGPYLKYTQTMVNLCNRIKNNPTEFSSVQQMADILRLSPNFFSRVFHDIAGMPPMEYVRKCRLEQIKTLLISTEMTVSEIAEKCNFEDVNYLRAFFRRYTCMTPSEYRKSALASL